MNPDAPRPTRYVANGAVHFRKRPCALYGGQGALSALDEELALEAAFFDDERNAAYDYACVEHLSWQDRRVGWETPGYGPEPLHVQTKEPR